MEKITEIKVNELRKENINYKHEEQVELLGKSIRMSNRITLFLLFPLTFFFKFIFIIDILCIIGVLEGELVLQFPLMYFAGAIVLYVQYILKIENKFIKKGPSRLQYGVVSSKYTEASQCENGTSYNYYIDVLFPEDNTKLKKSEVSRSMYGTMEKEDSVLAISFNDKKSYAIKTS